MGKEKESMREYLGSFSGEGRVIGVSLTHCRAHSIYIEQKHSEYLAKQTHLAKRVVLIVRNPFSWVESNYLEETFKQRFQKGNIENNMNFLQPFKNKKKWNDKVISLLDSWINIMEYWLNVKKKNINILDVLYFFLATNWDSDFNC